MIEVLEIDLSKFNAEMALMPKSVLKGAMKGAKTFLETVQTEARKTHRHRRQSGNLEKSIEVKMDVTDESGKVYFEEGEVDYGKYVHEGHPHVNGAITPTGWQPDQFIYESFDKNKDNAQSTVEKFVTEQLLEDGII